MKQCKAIRMSAIAPLAVAVLAAGMWAPEAKAGEAGEITYAKHVAHIIRKSCEPCHYPGGIGPFSLSTYRQVAGWSKMILEVIDDGRMPPWHADPNHGQFANDRSMSKEEKDAIRTWVANDMPRGEREDMPEPVVIHDGWRIGEPDAVFEMPQEVTIPASGVIPYMHIEVPTGFTEDKWVQAMEALPGNDKVVHHILMFVRTPQYQGGTLNEFLNIGRGFLTGYAPGTVENVFDEGRAVRIPAGSSLIFQMHYTPTGKTEVDRSKFGVVFADGPPEYEVVTATTQNFDFKIPPHDPSYEVVAETVFPESAILYSMTPHMHYRGKQYRYIAIYPDGTEETLLYVPNYDFKWQTSYILKEPAFLPKGTTLKAIAHFDNSENNPYNPDPTKPVRWGDQTWEEMMIAWMTLSWVPDDYQAKRTAELQSGADASSVSGD